MHLPLGSRVGRLAVIERLLAMVLVAPKGISLRLFSVLGREVRDLRLEIETELQLEGLLLARLTATAREPPAEDRTMLDEPTLFDDGEHLVEDQIVPAVYERLT